MKLRKNNHTPQSKPLETQQISDKEAGAAVGGCRDQSWGLGALPYDFVKKYFPDQLERYFGKE